MITANVIQRVFMISLDKSSAGTAFAVDFGGRQYLVTARHVVEGVKDKIYIFSNQDWSELDVDLVGHSEDVDVSVLAPRLRLTPPNELPLEIGSKGVTYGQDVYFLGFPYGLTGNWGIGERGYPVPHVKKAIVSSLGQNIIFLDGHNNPGFSGGPVVFLDPFTGTREFKVAAVVSAYHEETGDVYHDGAETGLKYLYNAGIVHCPMVDLAAGLIGVNPIGFLLLCCCACRACQNGICRGASLIVKEGGARGSGLFALRTE